MGTIKNQIHDIYAGYTRQIVEIVNTIHSNPELSEEETLACDIQCTLLEKWGFLVEKQYKNLPTAYNATYGQGRPHLCIMSEYDALPGIGHGCGHNLITGVALGTGIVLKTLMAQHAVPGTITVMGTPAEEKRGCKIDLIKAGALKDIDMVMMAHPNDEPTCQSNASAGIMQFHIRFTGRPSHAASAPEKGINALDAIRLLFNGIDAWRQQLPETARVHGVITNGGDAPNIIPETAAADVYLRDFDLSCLQTMKTRFENIARGAALMTDAALEITEVPNSYKPCLPNEILNKSFMKLAGGYEMNPVWAEPSRASSDFGDVSHEVPAIHGYFNITGEKKDIVIHSKEFTACAASEFGMAQMEKTIWILSEIGYEFLTSESFRKDVQKAFQDKK